MPTRAARAVLPGVMDKHDMGAGRASNVIKVAHKVSNIWRGILVTSAHDTRHGVNDNEIEATSGGRKVLKHRGHCRRCALFAGQSQRNRQHPELWRIQGGHAIRGGSATLGRNIEDSSPPDAPARPIAPLGD